MVGTVLGSVAVSASPTFDLGTPTPIENPPAPHDDAEIRRVAERLYRLLERYEAEKLAWPEERQERAA